MLLNACLKIEMKIAFNKRTIIPNNAHHVKLFLKRFHIGIFVRCTKIMMNNKIDEFMYLYNSRVGANKRKV